MKIIPAHTKDISIILSIIAEARQIMRENGNLTQWTNGYPSKTVIEEDVSGNQAYLCFENDEIVGYFCLIVGDNPESSYDIIEEGAWLNLEPYGVIHRLASGRKVKGIAQAALDFAFSKITNIKIDTHRDNVPMQHFLEKNDFTYCGVIYVQDGTPRDAYQKIIS